MPSVIIHKEKKVTAVFEAMQDINDEQEFVDKFKAMYPDDWTRIIARYEKEERATKPGRPHPMPRPEIYLSNMYKVGLKKRMENREG